MSGYMHGLDAKDNRILLLEGAIKTARTKLLEMAKGSPIGVKLVVATIVTGLDEALESDHEH